MDLREERAADRESVRNVQLQAFGGDHGPVVARLVDALRELITPGDGLSLVAALDGQVVGHVMFTRSLLDAPRRLVGVQVLSPLGVLRGHQQRGVGSALVRHGLAAIAGQGAPVVFLEGDPRYYSRFGFTPGGVQGFRKPSLRIPDDAFLPGRPAPAVRAVDDGDAGLRRALLALRLGRPPRPQRLARDAEQAATRHPSRSRAPRLPALAR